VRRPPALLTAAVLIAGCNGDDEKSERTITAKPEQTVRVVGDEYSFDPANIVLPSGPLRVELKNEGVLAHNLRVIRDDRDLGGTDTFQGGKTRSAQVAVGPGRYELVCTVGNHADLGMRGELVVR
jgi:plastocyanin